MMYGVAAQQLMAYFSAWITFQWWTRVVDLVTLGQKVVKLLLKGVGNSFNIPE